jgi:hypothetical protein
MVRWDDWNEQGTAMIRAKARYRNQALELDLPLALAEGAEVQIDIHFTAEAQEAEHEGWTELGISRLEEEWDRPEDRIYDNWKTLYGV